MNFPVTLSQAIDGLLYADAYDCALTLEEIHRFSRVKLSKDQIRSWLDSPYVSNFIFQESGFYYLRDRKSIVAARDKAITRAGKLRKRAMLIARLLHFFPFVRGIVLTGSVAANDADSQADIDFLVIVADARISFVFFLLGGLSRIFFRRLFCPNYYLVENSLSISRRSFYIAREIAQAIPLTGMSEDFFRDNAWVDDELPNSEAKVNHTLPLKGSSFIQKVLEFPCNWVLRNGLEEKLKSFTAKRLLHHYHLQSVAVPDSVEKGFEEGRELRFHFGKRVDTVMQQYENNREALMRHLKETGGFASERNPHEGNSSSPSTKYSN
ncbi:MAG: nucleotidyltransferase domain-containing protein [Mariniblastus sp.]|nr:nucleotidyltransferase domain-containing protein [Mariniblastus sp.]